MSKKNVGVLPNYVRPVGSTAHALGANLKTSVRDRLYNNEIEVGELDEVDHRQNSNIYMLCFRNEVRFVPGSIYVENATESLRGLIEVNRNGSWSNVPFEANVNALRRGIFERLSIAEKRASITEAVLVFEVDVYPHTQIKADTRVRLADGSHHEEIVTFDIDGLSRLFKWHVTEVQDLEIRYIGQSIGRKYPRDARHRLGKQHHQHRINLTNEQVRRRDLDLMCLYLDFDAHLASNTEEHEIEMPRPNILDLIEGSLIYHFKPRENEQEKIQFPETSPGRAARQRLGVDRIITALSSDDSCYRFYSDCRPPRHFSMVVQSFETNGYARERYQEANVAEEPPGPETGWHQLQFLRNNKGRIHEIHKEIINRYQRIHGQLGSSRGTAVYPYDSEIFGSEIPLEYLGIAKSSPTDSKSFIWSAVEGLKRLVSEPEATRKPQGPSFSEALLLGMRKVVEPLVKEIRRVNVQYARGVASPVRAQALQSAIEHLNMAVLAANQPLHDLLRATIKAQLLEGKGISLGELAIMHPILIEAYDKAPPVSDALRSVDEAFTPVEPSVAGEVLQTLSAALKLVTFQTIEALRCDEKSSTPESRSDRRRQRKRFMGYVDDERCEAIVSGPSTGKKPKP